MALLLTDNELSPLFFESNGVRSLIDVVEAAFRENVTPSRDNSRTVKDLQTQGHSLLTMSLDSPTNGVSVRTQVRGVNGRPLVRNGAPVHQTIQLFDRLTGELDAMIWTSSYEYVRTALATAVGCRFLSPDSPKTLGVIGSSTQARGHIPVLLEQMPSVEEVLIFSSTRDRRESFAAEMRARVAADVRAVDDARSAVEGVDVLAAVANAEAATFDPEWVKPGALVASIARGQLPPALAHSARFIASTQTGFAEGGRRGTEAPSTINPGWESSSPVGSLLDVIEGSIPAREDVSDRVLFMLMGIPSVDTAVARHALDWARANGVGIEISA